jgi:class 3 adenylate cyclase/tetratricopeptide (TPR) repeat protein
MLGPGPPANDEAAPSPASASDVLNALLPSQLANYTRTLATQLARSEKRTLHAFFLEVNTDFDAGLDSQRLRTSMTELFAGLSTLIEAHGGMGERFMGSCLVAIFGLRALAEDDAERCLHAAKQARAFVTEFAQRLSTTLTVRIGVCAATVSSIDPEAGLQDNPAVNEVLNLARKVESVAGPGEIVMTQRVRSAAKEAFLFEDGPTLHASAEPLYRLSGADETHATPPEPLAGRQREHQLLSAFLDHLKQRHSGGALLVGQPGIGKSRMLRLAVQLAQDRTIRVARAKGGRFGQAPLDTIRQLVHSVTFPERHDFDDVARTTLKGLARLGLENADIQRLENLFSMGPTLPGTQALADEERYHDRAALLEVFAKATKDQPLLLVIDDAHAADRLSLEVIEDIVARASDGHPLGLLCAARAGETDATLTRLKRIEIGPLSPNEMSHLIGDVLKRGQVPAGLHEAVWARCEGNPQYCKELVQSLAESGHLQFANGAWKFDPNDSELPDSLAHVVAARLERTSPHARTLLRLGAVIGRTFPIDLVAASVETPIDVSAAVDECLRRGLLERVEQFKGTLQFSQVLIRDSIVARLSAVDRRRLHQMVGEAIERGCSAGSEHPLDAMSRHFVGSEQPRKAMKYLRQAANRWVEKHAYDIAAKQYQEALQLLLREAARLGPMSITTAGHVLELAAAATHAQSMDDPSAALAFLDEATKDVPESVGGRPRAEAIRQRGLVLTKLSRPVEAAKDLKRALTFLTAAEDTAQVIAVRVDLAAAYEGAGQLAPATAELVEVLRLMGTRHTKDPNALWPCLNQLGRVHLRLGKPNEARSFFESALTAAEEASSPTGQGRVVANQMVLAAQEGDGALAERLYAKALSLSRAGGDRLGAIRLQYNHATWLRNAGRVRQADAELREVAQRARDLGWKEGEAMAAAIRTPTSVAGSGAHS